MRNRKRHGVVLGLVVTAALAVVAVAVAAPNGNSSSLTGSKIAPSTLPKTTYKAATLTVHTHANYAHPGSSTQGGFTDHAQIYFDNDGKLTTTGIPTCDKTKVSGTKTMAQAMAACGSAKVGSGTAAAYAGANLIHGCALIFNGKKNASGQATDLIFTRVNAAPPFTMSCANPASNTSGNTNVLLLGTIKPNPASLGSDFAGGKMLDVPNIDAASPLPLVDFNVSVNKGKYISARCHDANKQLNIKGKFTYSDGQSDSPTSTQTCKVG
jgi:hypothetical protein